MKKPKKEEPTSPDEAEELTEEEAEDVVGGVMDDKTGTVSRTSPGIFGCDCKKGQGGTEDWKAIG